MKRNYFLVITVMLLTTLIIGCNMMKGAGQDVKNTGENIKETVDRND